MKAPQPEIEINGLLNCGDPKSSTKTGIGRRNHYSTIVLALIDNGDFTTPSQIHACNCQHFHMYDNKMNHDNPYTFNSSNLSITLTSH